MFKFTDPNNTIVTIPINKPGSCFKTSYNDLINNPAMPKGTILCHGIALASAPGQKGMKIAHAWLEYENYAFDTTWGIRMDKLAYRTEVHIEYIVQYNQEKAKKLHKEFGGTGPFDDKIIKVALEWKRLMGKK